jgi:hypothetical protein
MSEPNPPLLYGRRKGDQQGIVAEDRLVSADDALALGLRATNLAMSLLLDKVDVRKAAPLVGDREGR